MRAPFKAVRSGVRVNLDRQEREILVQLLDQLDALLDDGTAVSEDPLVAMTGMSGLDFGSIDDDESFELATADDAKPASAPPSVPDDPALARLLPEGNRDDPEASAEYRRLTEFGLRARKRSGARLAAQALGRNEPVVLASDEALALMKAFTDVRLVLGERLELRTDEDAEQLHEKLWAGEGSEFWLATASIYELLTSWQEYLIAAVTRQK
jgi:hypothetical protein